MSMRAWSGLLALVVLTTGACGEQTMPGLATLDTFQGGPTDTRIVVTGIHGSCDEVLAATVVETESEVRVRVPLAVEEGVCIALGVPLSVPVKLKQPLGERRVFDDERDTLLQRCPSDTDVLAEPPRGLCSR